MFRTVVEPALGLECHHHSEKIARMIGTLQTSFPREVTYVGFSIPTTSSTMLLLLCPVFQVL